MSWSSTLLGGIVRDAFPPRIALYLPLVLFAHQAEEWFLGFPEWTRLAVGDGVEPERFLVINAVGLALFTIGTWAAFTQHRMEWIVVALAALLGLNGIVHPIASMLVGHYSPGTATGLLVSLPVSVFVLRASAAHRPRAYVITATLAGVLLHGFVSALALA